MSLPDLLVDSTVAMAERVFAVSELIRQINLDLYRYNDISVEGQVTNFTRSAAGHLYFSIKDSRAQMRVVLFATNSRFLRFRIEDGLQLVVRGRLTLYEQKGEFQLNAVAVEPAGLGALQLAFEQLKKQLADEGLFDPARKKSIPMLPQRIAIVTSPTGAAIRDVLNVLGRRFDGLSVQIYPVRVQGRDASREIAMAMRHLASSDRLGLLPRRIASRRERLDRGRVTLFRMLEARARSMRSRLAAVNAPLLRFPAQVARERERLRSTAATLGAVSPLSVLSRGYAIAFSRTKRGRRKPIMNVATVGVGEPMEGQLE